MNPYEIVNEFENYIAVHCGSKYAVAVDSCTNALFLCCKYLKVDEVTIPSRTYVSVPCSIIHAGGRVRFDDFVWDDRYDLMPYPITDCSCVLARGMYVPGTYQCISFSGNKPIPIGKGGMILTDNARATEWFKLARYMGRHETELSEDHFDMVGWNMYMTPEQAARGLLLARYLEDYEMAPKIDYPDLSSYPMYTQT